MAGPALPPPACPPKLVIRPAREEITLEGPARLAMPALFVPLWSSGVIVGALALRHGPPFAVTGLRFALAALLLAGLARALRVPWPRGKALFHATMVGLLLQGAHYAGIYAGLAFGMSAGVAGLVVGLIPVATAIGAVWALGEPFTRRRAGAALLGALAAWLAVRTKLGPEGGVDATLWLAALALAGGAGAALWQKRFGVGGADLGAAAVQNLAGVAVMAACWWALEAGTARAIDWGSVEFLGAFTWLVLGNSIAANLLLLFLLARGAAGQVTGLFFLVPPVTALAAIPFLGEWPGWALLLAIALGAAAVRLLAGESAAQRL